MIWVRSQNRLNLVKVSKVYVVKTHVYGDCEFLGKYSSEEKALKVLDMMQDEITRIPLSFSDTACMFEMPLDEEV